MQAFNSQSESQSIRRARGGALGAFVTNGALLGSVVPRYPEVADALGLTTGQLGLVVTVFAVGATSAMHLPGWWLRRFGSRRVTTWGTWVTAGTFLLAGLSTQWGPPGIAAFVVCMFLAGLTDAIVDVSQNAQGLRVQAAFGRSLLSSMHAGWSAGAALGGALAALAAQWGLPLPVHLALSGLLSALLVSTAARLFLPDRRTAETGEEPDADTRTPPAPLHTAALAVTPIVLIALGGFAVEDIGNNWSAYYLHTELGLTVGHAALGVTTVLGAQFIGRAIGDRLIDLLGPKAAVRASLVAVAIGMLTTAWAPQASLAFAGLALAGLGCAITVPVAFAQADDLPGLAPHQGIAVVGWLMRLVTLAISPLIGLIGETAGLRLALTGAVITATIGLLLSHTIRDTRPRTPSALAGTEPTSI